MKNSGIVQKRNKYGQGQKEQGEDLGLNQKQKQKQNVYTESNKNDRHKQSHNQFQNSHQSKLSNKQASIQASLPHQINELIKRNKYLEKQNKFLHQQLKQKQYYIKNLKKQIYDSILQDTQNKLQCLKLIQQQSQIKAKQVFHKIFIDVFNKIIEQKMLKIYQTDQQFVKLKQRIQRLQAELKKQKKANEILATNVVQLKEYIIQAMEEKDLIIYQLKQMIIVGENEGKGYGDKVYQDETKLLNDYEKTMSMARARIVRNKEERGNNNDNKNQQERGNSLGKYTKEINNRKQVNKAKIIKNT